MDQLSGQQLQILLSMTVLVHCAMGLCLYGFARMSGRSTLLWSLVGLIGGLLGLIAYIVYSIREMSADPDSRKARFRGDEDELASHLLSQTDMQGETDHALEELISEGYLEKARQQAREKLQAAFNYGDGMRERIYRGYLSRIEELSGQATSEISG